MKILYDSLTFGPTFSVVTFSLPHFRSGQEGRGGGGGGEGGAELHNLSYRDRAAYEAPATRSNIVI